jgi:tetratricopeptide (TPR) repeat protein
VFCNGALRRLGWEEKPLLSKRSPGPRCALSPRRHAIASALIAAIALLVPVASLAQADKGKEGDEKWYLERGRTNMEIGNYKAAIEAYQKAAKIDPNNREAMKQLGVAYEKQGLTTEAIKQYDRYLERFKDDADIAFKQADYLGWSRFAYRREDAIKYYKMGLAVRDDTDRRHKLAQLLGRDRKQLDEAVTEYRTLLKAQPNNAEWRAEYRKLLLWDDKYMKEAIQEYRQLSQQKKGDFETDHTLAQLIARQDPKSDEARKLYADLVKRKPKDDALRREYTDLLSGSAPHRSEAIEEFRKLAASDQNPETRHKLARLLAEDRSHLDEAIAEYRKLLEAQPNNAQWREEYRKLLLWGEGHTAEAIKEQRKVVAANPKDIDAKRTLAQLLARENPNSEEARSLTAEVLKSRPNDAALRQEYADLLSGDASRRGAAIEEYQTLLAKDSSPETRHKLARLMAGDPAHRDEAVEQYRTLLSAQPDNPAWRDEYRQLLLSDEKYRPDAVREYRRITNERPGDVEAKHTLAMLLVGEDPKSKEALSLYGDLVKRSPGDAGLRLEYADLLASDPAHRDDAIEQYRVLMKGNPQPDTRYKFARLLAGDRAHVDEALEQYRLLLKTQAESKEQYQEWRTGYRQALLWDEKNTKEAITEYRRFAAEKQGDFEVHHTLAQLLARDDPRSAEAVSLYGSLVQAHPDDHELRLEYVHVLSADPQRRAEAIEQYRKLVESEPTPETREALADLLAAQPDGRAEARKQYDAILREHPDNSAVRLKYAQLLAADRKTTPQAVEEYEGILAKDPKNGTAHLGLAQGYAAMRERNKALQEANLASKYGAPERDVADLRKNLRRGQEPNLQAFVRGFVQRGKSKSTLDGIESGLGGRVDAGNALTLKAEGGGEDYWRGGHDAAGVFGRADTDFHLGSEDDIGLGIGYHTIGDDSVVGRAEYKHLGESVKFSLGADRSLRYDSYLALVGGHLLGDTIGSARENRAHIMLGFGGDRASFTVTPYGGFVDARGIKENPFGGGRAELRFKIHDGERVQVSPILAAEGFHYQFNAFGEDLGPDGVRQAGEARPGGYFSPQLFGSAEVGLAIAAHIGDNAFLDLEGGPALQYVKEQGLDSDTGVGGQGKLEFVYFFLPSVHWAIGADIRSFGSAYTRAQATTRIGFEF